MGRGLSDLQREILATVEASSDPLTAGDIREAMGLPSTPVGRASLSRSLQRLVQRNELVALVPEVCITGKGYRYARNDQGRVVQRVAARGGQE